MKLISLLVLTLLISCKNDSTGSSSVTLGASSGGVQLRWVRSTPLNLKVSDQFNNEEVSLIESMLQLWDNEITNWNSFNYPLDVTPNIDTTALTSYHDSTLGIYQINNWPASLGSGTLAVTQYFGFTRNNGAYIEITHGDILINEDDYNFSTDPDGVSGLYDLPSVVLHEVGHLLGLRHSSNYDSVMVPYMFSGTIERALYQIDKSNMALNYNQFGFAPLQSSSSSGAIAAKSTTGQSGEETADYPVRGVIELKASGLCRHFVNGTLTEEHY